MLKERVVQGTVFDFAAGTEKVNVTIRIDGVTVEI
jgi:hypothetical protein